MGWLRILLVGGTALASPAGAGEDTLRFGEKGVIYAMPDGVGDLTVGGRLHLDAAGGQSLGAPLRDVFDQTVAVRRARLAPVLTLGPVILLLDYEFADPRAPIRDLAASLKPSDSPLTVTVGSMKEPFGLEALTSNNNVAFLERALPTAFVPSRRTGAAFSLAGEQVTVSAGLFGGDINGSVEKGGTTATARVTVAPWREDDRVLHFGLAASSREVDRRGPSVFFASLPESNLFAVDLVDTGDIEGARRVARVGLEAALAAGPMRLQAEYIGTRVERSGRPDLGFQGGYVQASLVLNGGGAAYSTSSDIATQVGRFGGVGVPEGDRLSRGGTGIFEIAVRASAIDLDSRDIRGGKLQTYGAGLNWYPDRNVRVMLNYVRAVAENSVSDGADIVQGRLQIAF